MAEEFDGGMPPDREVVTDIEKRKALSRLQDRYGEARGLVSSDEAHSDLEWILGPKRNRDQRLTDLDEKMIQIIALWLQDLASEVDRALPQEPTDAADETARSALEARLCVATNLREAAEGFAVAFRRPS